MRFWGKDPEFLESAGEITIARMIAHYRMNSLREAHSAEIQEQVGKILAKDGDMADQPKVIFDPFAAWNNKHQPGPR